MPVSSRERLKAESGLEGRPVISTFGLLSPGKGLEYGIEAIAKVAKNRKDVVYYILGQTHPAFKKASGENYRNSLMAEVSRLGIDDNVVFVNKYLTKEEIIRYLKLSDIYLTPYLGRDQAVSGTLAYAVGYGRVIVSTPYSYAKEMLSQGRGLLAKFSDSESIADCIEYVLDHPKKKEQMEQKTYETGETMLWNHIAQQYKDLFVSVMKQHEKILASNGKVMVSDGNFASSGGNFAVPDGNLAVSNGNFAISSGNLAISSGNLAVSSGNLAVSNESFASSDGKFPASL
jgi:glycosyltransferase involved in cell wall biosynthesis